MILVIHIEDYNDRLAFSLEILACFEDFDFKIIDLDIEHKVIPFHVEQ